MKKFIKIIIVLLLCFTHTDIYAQSDELFIADQQKTVKARVIDIIKQEAVSIPGTEINQEIQTLKIKILDGDEKGKTLEVENDYQILKQDEIFYLKQIFNSSTNESQYSVGEPYRLPQVLLIIVLFLIVLIIFGGIQGMRGLISLIGSLLLIFYILVPGIIKGISPLFITIGVSSLIIIVGSYITHGFNKMTSSAVLGMLFTVSFTGLLAFWSVSFTKLSGFGSEEVVYLNITTPGGVDVMGLLLAGIMIGLLGILYDVAISQATAVEELYRMAGPGVSKKIIFTRAVRMGREHIGAVVNTLAIAYIGISLPLILLFSQSVDESIIIALNREIFSEEILRIMIGSIGLILAMPITTLVSVFLLQKKDD